MKVKYMNGLSFAICIGKWVSQQINIGKTHIRIVVGFVSFTTLFYDLERRIMEQVCKALGKTIKIKK